MWTHKGIAIPVLSEPLHTCKGGDGGSNALVNDEIPCTCCQKGNCRSQDRLDITSAGKRVEQRHVGASGVELQCVKATGKISKQ